MKIQNNPYQRYYSSSYKIVTNVDSNIKNAQSVRGKLLFIPYLKSNTVLDIACGTGYFGTLFGGRTYGFDMNPHAVVLAKKNGVQATVADAEKKWKYPNGFFDVVIASHILEHVRNPDDLILQAKRVLKRGGYFIVLTPNLAAWFNRLLLLFGYQPFFTEVSTVDKTFGLKFTRRLSGGSLPVGHLRVFTLGALIDILQFHGFEIGKKTGHEFGSFPKWIQIPDRIFSMITPLSSTLIVIAQKK